MSGRSIIIAANPYFFYYHSGNNKYGDVEAHRSYLRDRGKVFWCVASRRDVGRPWSYPDIERGYFYIPKEKSIRYVFHIERIARLREFGSEFDEFVPPWRKTYWHGRRHKHDFGFLIDEIESVSPELTLQDFVLANNNKTVRRVQNYVIAVEK